MYSEEKLFFSYKDLQMININTKLYYSHKELTSALNSLKKFW